MEQKGIALTILGVVAIIAIVGLVLLFTGATGRTVGYRGAPGGVTVLSSNNVCAGVVDCNGPGQPTWAGYEMIAGQKYNKCMCPGEPAKAGYKQARQ